ncbi:MAG: hypothetical protein P8M61_02940 [Crocinitomicaceae bacterium]|nr:hypothetical protein [Crocinitomicaceae bacterium]
MNKLKTKYNALAQCKNESLSLSIALLAKYRKLPANKEHYIKNHKNIYGTNLI